MMKQNLMILLLLVSARVFAPSGVKVVYLGKLEGIDPYRNLKHAIGMVEASYDGETIDSTMINEYEQAYGFFQIRQIRLDHYYQDTGVRYSLNDMLNYKKAEEVFMHFAEKIGADDPCKIARRWNGSGPMTWDYWKRVQKYLVI